MSKKVGYITHLIGVTQSSILSFARRTGITPEEGKSQIDSIQKEFKYALPMERIKELRALLNPSGIGVVRGVEGRLKYARKPKVQELPDAPEQEVPQVIDDTIGYEQPADLHGLIVPIGTIIAVFPKGQTYGRQYYRVTSIRSSTFANIKTCNIQGNITNDYEYRQGISGINKSLRLQHWHLVNETPAFVEALKNYTNVVPYRNFKRTDTSRNTNGRVIANAASYAIEVEGTRIPFSPGFTGNCQLTVLGHMNTLLQMTSDLKGQLKEVYHAAGRKLLMCDVNLHNVKLIKEKLPKSWIHSEMPYKSTNGSDMVVCLIDISKK